MSHADTLRAAAALMRERAQTVPPSPWWAYFRRAYMGVRSAPTPEGPGHQVGTGRSQEAGEYIASWHPDVTLAAATMLEHAAVSAEAAEDVASRVRGRGPIYDGLVTAALPLASAYLHQQEASA